MPIFVYLVLGHWKKCISKKEGLTGQMTMSEFFKPSSSDSNANQTTCSSTQEKDMETDEFAEQGIIPTEAEEGILMADDM